MSKKTPISDYEHEGMNALVEKIVNPKFSPSMRDDLLKSLESYEKYPLAFHTIKAMVEIKCKGMMTKQTESRLCKKIKNWSDKIGLSDYFPRYAYWIIGRTFISSNNFEVGLFFLKKAENQQFMSHDKSKRALNYDIATTLILLGKLDEAEEYLERPENEKDSNNYLLNKASILDKKGDEEGAKKYYKKALEKFNGKPIDAIVLDHIFWFCYRKEEFDSAEKYAKIMEKNTEWKPRANYLLKKLFIHNVRKGSGKLSDYKKYFNGEETGVMSYISSINMPLDENNENLEDIEKIICLVGEIDYLLETLDVKNMKKIGLPPLFLYRKWADMKRDIDEGMIFSKIESLKRNTPEGCIFGRKTGTCLVSKISARCMSTKNDDEHLWKKFCERDEIAEIEGVCWEINPASFYGGNIQIHGDQTHLGNESQNQIPPGEIPPGEIQLVPKQLGNVSLMVYYNSDENFYFVPDLKNDAFDKEIDNRIKRIFNLVEEVQKIDANERYQIIYEPFAHIMLPKKYEKERECRSFIYSDPQRDKDSFYLIPKKCTILLSDEKKEELKKMLPKFTEYSCSMLYSKTKKRMKDKGLQTEWRRKYIRVKNIPKKVGCRNKKWRK